MWVGGGATLPKYGTTDPGERVVAWTAMPAADGDSIAIGTSTGVVKRVQPDYPARDSWELIALKPGDEVVAAVDLPAARVPSSHLVFVSSDAQLLHFPAGAVRPQGRTAAGMAGIRLTPNAGVVYFGVIDTAPHEGDPSAAAVVVTIAGSSAALPGTDSGTGKVTVFTEYPVKGRATGGVRCHRFLKGEDRLLLAWVGPAPARATTTAGSPLGLPSATGRRDGSGVPMPAPVHAVG